MAAETLRADGVVANSACVNPANAQGAPDGTWTGNTDNTNWDCRWSVGDPANELTSGHTSHTAVVLVRKSAAGGNGDPTVALELWSNGVLVRELVAATTVTSTVGVTLQNTFTTAEAGPGADLQVRVIVVAVGGSPAGRRNAQADGFTVTVDTTEVSGADVLLAGASGGSSSASGVLSGEVPLAGAAAGASSASGVLSADVPLAGSAVGASSAQGLLSGEVPLVGSAAGLSAGAGVFSLEVPLAGLAAGSSSASGVLTGDLVLTGTAVGTSSAQGWLYSGGAMGIVTDGLTSHWDFKGGAGTTITDVVGANDGTLNGTTTNFWNRVDNHGDPVANTNGTDNWVNVPGVSTFPSGDFSFSVLFWPNRNSYADFGLFFRFHSGVNNGINARIQSSGIGVVLQGATQLTKTFPLTELWQMWLVLQVAYDSATGNYRIRLGKKEITGTHTIGTSVTDNLILLGASGGNRFAGRVGDVLWYNGKELSGAEMDQNLDALLERARGTVTIDTSDSSQAKTIISLPDDGVAADFPNLNQPIVITTANKIYVHEFVQSGAVGQATSYRFDKNWNLEETATPFGTSSLDASHRTPAIGVDVNDKPLLQPGVHGGAWQVRRGNAADDLDPSTAVADPGSAGDLTYAYFYRSPSTGHALFGVQDAGHYDWWKDDGASFTRLGGAIHYNQSGQTAYWGHLIEGPDGKLYSCTSWHDGSAGGPYHHVNVIYSDAAGTTGSWKRLTDDAAVTLPVTSRTADAVLPRTLDPSPSANDVTDHDFGGVSSRPAVTSDGRVHWVVDWSNHVEGDHATLRSNWYVRWNPTAKHFEHYRLLADDGVNNAGASYIVPNPADDSLHILVAGKTAVAYNVYLYSSFDQGDTWERRILHDQTVEEIRSGTSPDNEGVRIDNVLRMRMAYTADSTKAEVWEFALPAAGGDVALTGTAAGSSTAQGVLSGEVPLAGSAAGTSDGLGNLSVDLGLVGAAAGESTATGNLTVEGVSEVLLSGIAAGSSTALGALNVDVSLAGTAAGSSSAVGVLSKTGVTFWEPAPVAFTPAVAGGPPPW